MAKSAPKKILEISALTAIKFASRRSGTPDCKLIELQARVDERSVTVHAK
jgi:hypothetical protein